MRISLRTLLNLAFFWPTPPSTGPMKIFPARWDRWKVEPHERTSWAYNILQAHWISHLSQSSEILTNGKLLNSGRHCLHLTKWSYCLLDVLGFLFRTSTHDRNGRTDRNSALLMPKTANLRKGHWTKWPNPLRWFGCLRATSDIRG